MSFTTRRMGFGYITERERERQEEAAEHRSEQQYENRKAQCSENLANLRAEYAANPQRKESKTCRPKQ